MQQQHCPANGSCPSTGLHSRVRGGEFHVYGGSGGSVATFSLAGGANEIAIHEMGHAAFGLADEYACWAGGNETGRDRHPAGEPSEPNVTLNTNRATLKWGWAVAATTALLTMSNPNCSQVDSRASTAAAGTVGLFEGAHYYHCGAYRPEYDCKMRNLGVPFCRVCRQVIWNRLGPLATLQARTKSPLQVGSEQWLGWLVPGAGWHRLSRRHRLPDHCSCPLCLSPRSIHPGRRQTGLQLLVGWGQRLASLVSDRVACLPRRLHRECGEPV